ncbi:MAG: threonine ammonia-lyase [Alcaligenaceae bacterium]|nr:threonine ammonia-lyase [Alcaligenaceae bacterium]
MLNIDDIRQAAKRIQGQVVETPCLESKVLSELTGAQVFLKFENLQFTATFKERGAYNKLVQLSEAERKRGVIAMSAGNHAQGVAYHARRLDIPATIVMPSFTPAVKVAGTQNFGARVILHGSTLEAAYEHAHSLAEQEQRVFVHPYNDPAIMAGQGTIALEMLAQQPDLDTLVVPVGGGGLIAGIAVAAKAVKPDIQIIGVQTQRFPAMVNLMQGTALEQGISTIAEGIAVGAPGPLCAEAIRQHVDDWLLIDEGDIEHAIVLLLEVEKTLAEGAGAAALAALLHYPQRLAGRKVGMVLSGGNIDPQLLAQIIGRGLVRSGRLVRIVVNTADIPGSLARITSLVAECGANVDEVHHQRAFTLLAAKNVEIEMVLQTRSHEHAAELLDRLREAQLDVRLI